MWLCCLLGERLVRPGCIRNHTFDGRSSSKWVGGIDNRFPSEIVGPGQAKHLNRRAPQATQKNEIAVHCGLTEHPHLGCGILCAPVLESPLVGVARAKHGSMTMLEETCRKSLPDHTGTENTDLHKRPHASGDERCG